MTAAIILAVSTSIWVVWIVADLARDLEPIVGDKAAALCRTVFFEIKPFALPLIAVMHISATWGDPHPYNPGQMFSTGISLAYWWMVRNKKDDDDRWKRRRTKVTEAVRQVGGRLVVVPEGGAA